MSTRNSLLYPIAYLVPCSLALVFVPGPLLDLVSTGGYQIYLARLLGGAMAAFTTLVVMTWVHAIEKLYVPVIVTRVLVLGVLAWLYAGNGDPFFAIIFATVLPGVILTTFCRWRQRSAGH